MAVFQRAGRKVWWFEFEYRGRRYRESAGTRSKTLAIDIERKRRRDVEESANGIRRNRDAAILFPVAAKEWLAVKKAGWAPKSHVIASTDIDHLKTYFAKLLLTDITDHDVAQYQQQRRVEKAANKTINNEVGTLRAILRRYRLWAQVAPDVRMLTAREDAGRSLTPDEETQLLSACAASRSRSLLPAVTLALSTGLRLEELRLLRWRQVDFAHEALIVGKSKTAHGTGRAVPLNQRSVRALSAWAQQFPDRRRHHFIFPSEKVGVAGDDEIVSIFDTNPDKPIGSWKVSWTTARVTAGVHCRWHDLRHTTVTRLLERGVAFAIVATIMGWSPATSVRMAKRYGHIGLSPQREAMKRLDETPDPPTLGEPPPTVHEGPHHFPHPAHHGRIRRVRKSLKGNGSSGWTRTSNPPVNSRMLCH
jgi:integrase